MSWTPPDPAHGPELPDPYATSQWGARRPPWPGPPRWPVEPQPFSSAPHAAPQPYLRLLRTQRYRWWRPLVGLLVAVAAFLVIALAMFVAAEIVALVLTGTGLTEGAGDLVEMSSPVGFLLVNLSLASLILATWAAMALVHRERIGWLSSVVGRLRWRLLARYALFAVAVVIPAYLVYLVLPGESEPGSSDGGWPGIQMFALLATIVLLTTPLQAAGEEYAFRGYLSQAIGSWVRSPWLPVLVSAGLFALAHGTQGPWLFLDRLAFGLVASLLVIRTGGLEAGIALHAVNNVVSLIVAAALGELENAFTATDIPWPVLAVDLVMLAAFATLVLRSARRRKVAVRSVAGEEWVGA